MKLQFIRPGKPIENAYCESFNGKLRDECLSANWFASIADAQRAIEQWRREYNEELPHKSLGRGTPTEFTRALQSHILYLPRDSQPDWLRKGQDVITATSRNNMLGTRTFS